jgi:Fervidolysin N-terminal prodomain
MPVIVYSSRHGRFLAKQRDSLAKTERTRMLRTIAIGALVIMVILAVACGKAGDSLKEQDGIAQDRVSVQFRVPVCDEQVSALLERLGSRIMEGVYYQDSTRLVSVPEGKTAAEMIETLEKSELVEDAQPYYLYAQDEVTVKFNVSHDDERVTELLESLGSQVKRTYEYSDFVLVSVPKDKTVADMVDILSSNPLVEYAEPNYYVHI